MDESYVGRFPFPRVLWARVAPPPPEMKMYSLAMTPNGHLEGRGSLPPPVIMHTAATPMPTPKSSPNLDTAHSLLDSRRGSSSSMDPQLGDQKSLVGAISCPSPKLLKAFPKDEGGPHARPCRRERFALQEWGRSPRFCGRGVEARCGNARLICFLW